MFFDLLLGLLLVFFINFWLFFYFWVEKFMLAAFRSFGQSEVQHNFFWPFGAFFWYRRQAHFILLNRHSFFPLFFIVFEWKITEKTYKTKIKKSNKWPSPKSWSKYTSVNISHCKLNYHQFIGKSCIPRTSFLLTFRHCNFNSIWVTVTASHQL